MPEASDPLFITPSARKHGVTDPVIRHAFRNPITFTELGEGRAMIVGASPSGALIELGFVEEDDGTLVIFHAMDARPQYLR